MHASGGRARRANEDDEVPLVSRRDDSSHEPSYSRSHHYPHRADSYRELVPRNMSPEASGSRRRDPDDWRRGESSHSHDRPYGSSSDVHRHSARDSRDAYENGSRRPDNGWATRDAHFTNRSRDWDDRHDHRYSPPPYRESSSWGHEAGRYDRSPRRDDGRGGRRGWDERYQPEREDSGWRKDDRRDDRRDDVREGGDAGDHRWHKDARDEVERWQELRRQWSDSKPVGPRSNDDARSWEPAASWKPDSTTNEPRQRNANRTNASGKKKKGKKNKDREWRNDDGPLNNWQKRDMGPPAKADRSPKKRRSRGSLSRSPSRSPRPFSPGRRASRSRSRSRSRSISPRRQRRNYSPTPRGRSPVYDRAPASKRQRIRWSRSPASSYRSYDSRGRGRKRSASPASTITRSPSSSPPRRPKAVHRLPQATSVEEIAINLSKTAKKKRNRGGAANGKQPDNRPTDVSRTKPEPKSRKEESHVTSQTSSVQEGHSNGQDFSSSLTVEAEAKSGAASGIRVKAGFRPIGQVNAASSSLKRFFPDAEEEDSELPARKATTAAVAADNKSLNRVDHRHDIASPSSNFSSLRSAPGAPMDTDVAKRQNDDGSRAPYLPGPPTTPSSARPSSLQENGRGSHGRRPEIQMQSGLATPVAQSSDNAPDSARRADLYEIVSQVGEGTFGKVYKARNTVTGVHVALKRIRMEQERDGFPVTAMREIKLLQSLRHQNVVKLYEMMVSHGSVYMVFEYMDHDLTGVLTQTQFSFTDANLKSLCQQMLAGLAYLHHKGVIHRDIKGSNILLNNRGELKLADFGLARFYQKRRRSDYTNRVITLWYRPPELLLGTTVYGPEVDMWSAGCIMLELYTKKPVFQGNDDMSQLDAIYRVFGTPTPERWPGVADMPWYELVKPKETIEDHFRVLFKKWLSPAALDLAEQLLTYDPTRRATAAQALEAPYFTQEEPAPALPTRLSTLEGEWHELEAKRERERVKKRRRTEGEAVQQ